MGCPKCNDSGVNAKSGDVCDCGKGNGIVVRTRSHSKRLRPGASLTSCTMCCFVRYKGKPGLYALLAGHSCVESPTLKLGTQTVLSIVSHSYKLGVVNHGLAKCMIPDVLEESDFRVCGQEVSLTSVFIGERKKLQGMKVVVMGGLSGRCTAIIDLKALGHAVFGQDYFGLVRDGKSKMLLGSGDSGSPIFTEGGELIGIYVGRAPRVTHEQMNTEEEVSEIPRVGFLACVAMNATGVKLAKWNSRGKWIEPQSPPRGRPGSPASLRRSIELPHQRVFAPDDDSDSEERLVSAFESPGVKWVNAPGKGKK